MIKNIVIAVLAVAVIALGLVLFLHHPGKVNVKQQQVAQKEIQDLLNSLSDCYSKMDLPGFYQPFSRQPDATHVYAMKSYANADSLRNHLQMEYTRVSQIQVATAGQQITLIDADHAFVTCQGVVRFTDLAGNKSSNHIYNWSFLLEKQKGKWIIVHSQQSFGA